MVAFLFVTTALEEHSFPLPADDDSADASTRATND